MDTPKTERDIVKTAGRGVLYITLAKGWFMITGWILVFTLPRIFKWASDGDAEAGLALFGAYQIVIRGVSFINNGFVTGTIQAVSKFTSEDESRAGAIRATAVKVQGGLGLVVTLIYVAFAGTLSELLGSPDLALFMRITGGIILAYALYAVFIGSFNGRRLFSHQAGFDIVYSTLKTALILILTAAGLGVLGAVSGFLIAAVTVAVASAFVARPARVGAFPYRKYFSFGATLIIYTFLLNLVMSLDLWLLKGLVSRTAVQAGQAPAIASAATKVLAGQYSAAQGLAFIPYQAILSIAFVAFPMISKVTFAADAETSKRYVRKTLRFTAILIAGLSAVFVALPGPALGLVFPAEYQAASGALAILALGIAAFGLMVVSNTILNGAGLPLQAMAAVGATLAAIIAAVSLLLRGTGPGPETLTAAATGSALGMALGLVLSGGLIFRRFGTFWPWKSAFRIAAAGAVAVMAGRFLLPWAGKLATLGECVLLVGLYVLVLVALGEFDRQDLTDLRKVLKRGG